MASVELCRTLIVDDELLIRQGIKHYIDWEQEGFVIVGEASNGQEALELIELTKPHIIIVDIVMPIMDGEELTRMVKKRYPDIQIIILSSFGEFDYVRSTFQSGVVDYILKPKLDAQSLLGALKTAASRIPSLRNRDNNTEVQFSIEQTLEKLIAGYEVQLDTKAISKIFPYSHFWLLGLDLKIKGHLKKPPEALSLIKEKLTHAFAKSIKQAVCYPVTVKENVYVFLINGKNDDFLEIRNFIERFLAANLEIGGVLTEAFLDFSKVGQMYKHCLSKLLHYRFYFPNQRLLCKQNLPVPPPTCDHFNLDWFTAELKREHFDAAFQYLQEHVKALSSCYMTEVYEYKAFFGNIIFNITILLSNMDYDVKELEDSKYSYFKAIDEANSAQELMAILEQYINEVSLAIFSVKNQPDNLNMKRMMEYIIDHYAEPLTLTELAKHFHFNPSYLSSYFSTHNKQGFSEYLNTIRIEEAAKLLRQGKTPISEISSIVGYSDHSYFCKVFKKITGMSPSQYRRK